MYLKTFKTRIALSFKKANKTLSIQELEARHEMSIAGLIEVAKDDTFLEDSYKYPKCKDC